MTLSNQQLSILHDLACDAAKQAGDLIKQYCNTSFKKHYKASGDTPASQVVTEVDYKSEALILDLLASSIEKYDLALLSEEQPDDRQRLVKDYFWCIDPIDGTLAFSESKPGYAVSIALVKKDGTPMISAVFDPNADILYSGYLGHGVFKDMQRWQPRSRLETEQSTDKKVLWMPCDRSLVARSDFEHIVTQVQNTAAEMGFSELKQIHGQGAVMNAISVIERSHSVYFKFPKPQEGGGSLWDFAATACLFNELSLTATDFHGERLDLNRAESSFMNHKGVFFCNDKSLNRIRLMLNAPG